MAREDWLILRNVVVAVVEAVDGDVAAAVPVVLVTVVVIPWPLSKNEAQWIARRDTVTSSVERRCSFNRLQKIAKAQTKCD